MVGDHQIDIPLHNRENVQLTLIWHAQLAVAHLQTGKGEKKENVQEMFKKGGKAKAHCGKSN